MQSWASAQQIIIHKLNFQQFIINYHITPAVSKTMASSVEQEMKELEEAFHFGGFISFFMAIAIGVFLNKLCPRFKWDQSPPGPAEFRGIGNLHQVARGRSTLQKIQHWANIYGDVVALSLGHYKMVILSGYETIKKAYVTPQFSGRLVVKPFHYPGNTSAAQKDALAMALPKEQDVLRRLKNYSMGNVSESIMVIQNVAELVHTLRKLQGQDFVPHKMLTDSVVKSLGSVASAKMIYSEDPHFQSILESVQSIISSSSVSSGPGYFLTTFFPNLANSLEKAKNTILGNNNNNEKDPFQRDESEPTIMDAYLMDVDKLQKFSAETFIASGNTHKSVGDILNLLAATTESTRDTLIWAIYYLTRHPKVQEQVFEEIFKVLGKTRAPALEDIKNYPLTQAVIEEVFRLSSLAPLGYFHHTSEDIMFQGHFIPKNTLLCSNLYALHNDKKIWGDPESFRPDRFLSRNGATGQFELNASAGPVIPFSVSRSSLAEMLTRNTTFLYLTSLVQKFQFSSGSLDDKLIELGSDLMRAPKEFGIVARERY